MVLVLPHMHLAWVLKKPQLTNANGYGQKIAPQKFALSSQRNRKLAAQQGRKLLTTPAPVNTMKKICTSFSNTGYSRRAIGRARHTSHPAVRRGQLFPSCLRAQSRPPSLPAVMRWWSSQAVSGGS